MSRESVEFQLELQDGPDSEKYFPVTVRFQKGEGGRLAFSAFCADEKAEGRAGGEYEVSLVVRSEEHGSQGCWFCVDPPCPPNFLRWVIPCPEQK